MPAFVDRFLHRRYTQLVSMGTVTDRASPILPLIEKPETGGASINQGVLWAGPQGFSFDLFAAQQVAGQSGMQGAQTDEFNLPYGEYHGSVQVTSKGLAGSKGREDAYCTELASVMDTQLEAYGAIAMRKIFGPVGGAIGKILLVNGGGSNGELTLSIKNDTLNIVPGMILMAAPTSGNGVTTPRVNAGPASLGFVFNVFPDGDTDTTNVRVAAGDANGIAAGRALAVAGTVGLPANWANGDFLFRFGDISAGNDLSDKQVRSLQGFITLAAATDTYLGVNRAQHAGLSGFRLSAAATNGLSIKERIERLVNIGRKQYNATKVDTIGLGPDTWMELSQDVQDTGWQNFADKMVVGTGAIQIFSANGPLTIYNEPAILEADIWAMTIARLKIYTYDGFPGMELGDGLKLLRMPAVSGQSPMLEVRWRSYNCLAVEGRPWDFGRCASDVVSL